MAEPRTWERLVDPDESVRVVRLPSGELAHRLTPDNPYWSLPGYEDGVNWAQLLRWGPLTEVIDG